MAPHGTPLRLLLVIATFASVWTSLVHAQQNSPTSSLQLPSLRLNVTVKRTSMKVHGLSTFEIFASPVQVNSQVTFNAVSTFNEKGSIYTYKLVNGVLFLTTVANGQESSQCFAADAFVAVQDVLETINRATIISNVISEEVIECNQGALMETKIGGEPLALCISPTGLKVFSGDFDIDVTFTDNSTPISTTKMLPDQLALCERRISAATLTPSTIAILTGNMTTSVIKPT